ncbi:hypothetical protein M422DRAFT_69258 [Sphaerobolus stellatus SS14]|uniref:Protein phosphatase n=1 Tax=Sphaerobolus stellatus (strain SS14) TaxID=990650 RepID=A0A0C9VJJ2_SPHS4|nr:hypothetical protein M422DRAFT_69258 [Sphaerobolus stellatus SS14]
MGVADGVGGWSKVCKSPGEANSALFAKSLMHWCSYELALSSQSAPPPIHIPSIPVRPDPPVSSPQLHPSPHPLDILQRSYDRCLASFSSAGISGGSSTALIATLHAETLRIAHLGDCAICVIRADKLVYRSEEMQHAFNYPLQLGPKSPTLPRDARVVEVPVQEGDILVVCSDGMTDNLWDEDVLDEVAKFTRGGKDAGNGGKRAYENKWLPGMLSQALCSRAKSVSESRGCSTTSKSASTSIPRPQGVSSPILSAAAASASAHPETQAEEDAEQYRDEVPFARKAREEGIKFVGGKCDGVFRFHFPYCVEIEADFCVGCRYLGVGSDYIAVFGAGADGVLRCLSLPSLVLSSSCSSTLIHIAPYHLTFGCLILFRHTTYTPPHSPPVIQYSDWTGRDLDWPAPKSDADADANQSWSWTHVRYPTPDSALPHLHRLIPPSPSHPQLNRIPLILARPLPVHRSPTHLHHNLRHHPIQCRHHHHSSRLRKPNPKTADLANEA